MVGLKLDLSNSNITENTILKYSKKVSDIHKELQEKKQEYLKPFHLDYPVLQLILIFLITYSIQSNNSIKSSTWLSAVVDKGVRVLK